MTMLPNFFGIILIFCLYSSCNPQPAGKHQTNEPSSGLIKIISNQGPKTITRTIIKDKNSDMWLAAFDGVFRYNGKSFINMTKEVSSSRFFTVLEDKKGNYWFGSIGSGVYYYDGKSFQHYTTANGLLNNEVVCIYEDKVGNVWFGVNGGASCFDGRSFRNFVIDGNSMLENRTENTSFENNHKKELKRPMNEVNSIIEDSSGKFWFGTRGYTFIYDGDTFNTVTQNGNPFTNSRCIIEDKNRQIWLGGNDGLWRFSNGTFTKINEDFTGYIYEDENGNIWTSSQNAFERRWKLSRYDMNSLSKEQPIPTEIKSKHLDNKGMIFGISEAPDRSIWVGALDGVYRYNGEPE